MHISMSKVKQQGQSILPKQTLKKENKVKSILKKLLYFTFLLHFYVHFSQNKMVIYIFRISARKQPVTYSPDVVSLRFDTFTFPHLHRNDVNFNLSIMWHISCVPHARHATCRLLWAFSMLLGEKSKNNFL